MGGEMKELELELVVCWWEEIMMGDWGKAAEWEMGCVMASGLMRYTHVVVGMC
jgi:hypothetical protein